MYYVYDGRVFDDRDDLNDYRDDNPGGTTQRFNTKAEANASLGGMLTGSKPAPTKQPAPTQTGPVGTPSSPPKQMPGESGPFDPNAEPPAPAPAPSPEVELAPPKPLPDTKEPAPAPQQTGPIGTPSSDPTKTQPGETGPFDPSGGPVGEATEETGTDTPEPAPSPQEESVSSGPFTGTTYQEFVEWFPGSALEGQLISWYESKGLEYNPRPSPGYERNEAGRYVNDEGQELFYWTGSRTDEEYGRAGLEAAADYKTLADIEESFRQDQMLQNTFGSWNKYSSYIVERQNLIDQGVILDRWEQDSQLWDERVIRALQNRGGPNSLKISNLVSEEMDRRTGIDVNAEQGLRDSYGIPQAMFNSDGDEFVWNGSGWTLAEKAEDIGVGEIAQLGFVVALSVLGTPALASSLTSVLGATGANLAASSIINAATQLMTTGEIDIKDALVSGATSVLTGAALDAVEEAGIFEDLQEAVIGTTTDKLLDADGNVIGEIIRNSAGEVISSTGVSANEWFTYATELGATITEGQNIVQQLGTVLDAVPDWVYDAGFETAEAIDTLFEEAQAGTGAGGSDTGEGVSTSPVIDGVEDIFAGDAEQVEEPEEVEQETEEVPPEEDILADTTQEATGLEEGTITEDILGEYLEPIRADITASEERILTQTQEFLASALANLPPNISQEEVRAIVEEIIANAPQAETLSEEQVDSLVNSAVDAVRVDLETAETEREEIRAGQEAIRTELSSDIQSLEDRLNNLPPEIRAIVAEQLENLEITDDISSVRQAVTALEEVVSNIQPGTTPEQVTEQIEQADLVTATELETTAEGLFAAIQAMAEGQTVALTAAQSEMLAEIAEGDAEVIERLSQYQGQLEDYLEERDITFDTVTGELSSDIERLQQQAGEFEERVGERFDEATQQRLVLAQNLAAVDGRFEELSEADQRQYEELNLTINSLEEEFGVDFDRIEETQNILREYAEEEFGLVREELRTGLETASEERIRIEQSTNDKLEQLREGIAVQFTDAEARRLEELTGLEYRLLQNSAANAEEFNALLAEQGIQFEEVTDVLRADIAASEQRTGERITGLEERMDANAIEQLAQLTGIRAEFLEGISNVEAAAIASSRGLSDQITEEITGIRGETAAQIEGMNERLTERIAEYEAQTGEQLDIASEERAVLGGQLGTLTSDVARVAEDVIRAGGRIEELDEASRQRYDELGLSIDELSLRVGVNLEALQEGMLTQDAALRELIEETTQQTEQSLTERLEEAEQGFATNLSDTEANLLSQITGVEAGVLQQLAEVEGGLQSQFGEQFGQVQQQVAGLGEQVAGVGEGIGQLGQALGIGLLGLAGAQPTAQEIAAAMPRQPVEFDPFLKGLSPFQPLTPLSLSPVQQKDAVSELNKFIGRQTGMLV